MSRSIAGMLRRLARLCVGLVVGAIVALSAAYAIGPERLGPVSLAQYAPYPVFLVPAATACLLALFLGWRWRLAAVVALVLVVSQLMGWESGGGEDGPNRFRVMTWNVKDYITLTRRGGLAELAREVSRHNADVFVLQDARLLKGASESNPEAARELFGDRHWWTFGQYTVASRFPLHQCDTGDIGFRDEAHTYVRCLVTVYGTDVELVTTHFMTPRFGLSATRRDPLNGSVKWAANVSDRMTQARTLARDLARSSRPRIVAGDLNAPGTSLAVRALLDTGLRDAFAAAGTGFGYTWGHSLRFRVPFLRIDHILVSDHFGVADSFVGGERRSPHRPVIADLTLRR
ncbi:MAG: endonuclease/exonuclease/phosphatase family protein [Vicinamibacterales bacterium]